ncbi:MAG: arylesterase [Zhengella sp.]|uniref:arylesterase n=1 Tax=Zhengella sp. TaxID=2282762 RepID=UPI001D97C765|nr:arylesterase [Notoacmeibacter sp.]MCC0028354.1 arylesterase [Brucellaceae bacterium]
MLFKGWLRIVALLGSVLLAGAGTVLAGPVKIVGFGDSLMAGYQLAPDDGFTGQLEDALRQSGHDVSVINAGVSGDTSSGGLSRLDWSVPDDADLVILELGANDALRGIDPAVTRSNLDAMIARLKERKIAVLLAGMLAPPNMGEAYASDFNRIFPELAEKHGIPLHPFFLDGVAARKDLLLADGMHPNPQGVAVMVERILPAVKNALAADGGQQG